MTSNKPVTVETTPSTSMSPWEGFPLFHRLSHELDTMFGRFGFEWPAFEKMPTTWQPTMEMTVKGNEFLVTVDVPGMKKEDITVEVTEDHLVLHGERKHEKEEKKEGFYRTERTYGSFSRVVPLPEGVKSERTRATMHDGVLEISMPMMKVEATTRKVEIGEPTPVKTTKAA